MFKFGFGEQSPDNSDAGKSRDPPSSSRNATPAHYLINAPTSVSDIARQVDIVELCAGELLLRKSCYSVPEALSMNGADLVPGVYEGGFKLWECAEDLVVHVHRTLRNELAGKSVLEIGAGHALPAVVAAMAGAVITVHDFNEEVLRTASSVNVAMNLSTAATESNVSNARYIAGDWGSIPKLVADEKFDVILSSETVYAENQLHPLALCILSVLKDGGFALVAGKTYYFGVGGGMQAFRNVVKNVANELEIRLDIEIVQELRDGKSNVREIAKFWKNRKV